MKEILNEEWLYLMLDAARDSRIKKLKEELAASHEYLEMIKLRDDILKLLEQQIPRSVTDMLFQYGEAYGLLTAKTGDFFYERGFADCLYILGQTFVAKVLE